MLPILISLGGIRVHGLNYLIKNVTAEDRLLIVDDVFDTGRTIDAVISRLETLARLNTPGDIRVAVPYYKPERRSRTYLSIIWRKPTLG